MSSISAFQSGLSGIQKGLSSVDRQAAKIASAETMKTGDVTPPLVNMLSGKQQVEASTKVLQTSNDMLGSILDIKV